jgi:hypothetical protein
MSPRIAGAKRELLFDSSLTNRARNFGGVIIKYRKNG